MLKDEIFLRKKHFRLKTYKRKVQFNARPFTVITNAQKKRRKSLSFADNYIMSFAQVLFDFIFVGLIH